MVGHRSSSGINYVKNLGWLSSISNELRQAFPPFSIHPLAAIMEARSSTSQLGNWLCSGRQLCRYGNHGWSERARERELSWEFLSFAYRASMSAPLSPPPPGCRNGTKWFHTTHSWRHSTPPYPLHCTNHVAFLCPRAPLLKPLWTPLVPLPNTVFRAMTVGAWTWTLATSGCRCIRKYFFGVWKFTSFRYRS